MKPHFIKTSARGAGQRFASFTLGLLEYTPIFATILLAIYVGTIANGPETTQNAMLQRIIALLGLIATSILIDRFTKLRRIDIAVRRMNDLFSAFMSERIRAVDFFLDDLPPLGDEVENASKIFVLAVNGQAFIVKHKNALTERVCEGAELKVLVVDPASESALRIANPEKSLTIEYLQATARIAKQSLEWIANQNNTKGKGSVQLRYIDHIPMFSAYAFDTRSHRGKIAIGLYRQIWNHEQRPHAVLTKSHDGYWYDYYNSQIDEAWGRGTPVSLVATHAAHQNAQNQPPPTPAGNAYP